MKYVDDAAGQHGRSFHDSKNGDEWMTSVEIQMRFSFKFDAKSQVTNFLADDNKITPFVTFLNLPSFWVMCQYIV